MIWILCRRLSASEPTTRDSLRSSATEMRHKKFPPCCVAGREHSTLYFVIAIAYLTGGTSEYDGGSYFSFLIWVNREEITIGNREETEDEGLQ